MNRKSCLIPILYKQNYYSVLNWIKTKKKKTNCKNKNYFLSIRKTCQCYEYPLIPHFYIAKLGYAGVYLFFLFLLQNIDCVPTIYLCFEQKSMSTIYVLSKNKKNIKKIQKKFFIFYNFKTLRMLHGQVFVMQLPVPCCCLRFITNNTTNKLNKIRQVYFIILNLLILFKCFPEIFPSVLSV